MLKRTPASTQTPEICKLAKLQMLKLPLPFPAVCHLSDNFLTKTPHLSKPHSQLLLDAAVIMVCCRGTRASFMFWLADKERPRFLLASSFMLSTPQRVYTLQLSSLTFRCFVKLLITHQNSPKFHFNPQYLQNSLAAYCRLPHTKGLALKKIMKRIPTKYN